MPPPLQEITAQYVRQTWRSENGEGKFAFGQIRPVKAKHADLPPTIGLGGEWDPTELKEGMEYVFYGSIGEDNRGKPQLRFRSFHVARPYTRQGVITYLRENASHVGPTVAARLYEKWQGDAVRVLRESPDVVATAIKGISEKQALAASEDLKRLEVTEGARIELTDLLNGRGFSRNLPKFILKKWGNRGVDFVKANPYLLMAFRGCGFLKCDSLYEALGLPPTAIKRQALAVWHELASNRDGHVWFPRQVGIDAVHAKIGSTDVDPEKALSLAIRAKLISQVEREGMAWIAETRCADAEAEVSEMLAAKLAEKCEWPDVDAEKWDGELLPLNDNDRHQRDQLKNALQGAVSILGGSPGTGKTFSVACLVKVLQKHFGAGRIAAACPTGKAAVRLTESMAENKVELRANTIHSLLGVEQAADADIGSGWSFRHRRNNPLPYRVVLIDEFSMTSIGLLRSLLLAISKGTHVLFVGDVNQLPPVEYGAPLRDAIEAGLPYGELREIRRNAGSIVRVCAAIRDDQPWQCDDKPEIDDKTPADGIPRNLVHVPAGSGNADKVVVDLIQKIRKSEKYDPTWDVQVVVAVNDRSAVSRKKLNPLLQIECNPDGKIVPGCQYRVGDKAIMLANSMLIECDRFGVSKGGDNKVPVCNGEFGRILDVSKKKIICQFENPRRIVMVPRGTAEGGENASFDLGFSATVHKMQGSSAKIVIVVIDEYAGATGSFGICDRAWLYTAISRAEQCCFVVGKLSTMKAICKRQYIYRRKTFTVELIREELAARGVDASSFRASEAMRLSVEEESEFVVGMDGFRTDSREVAMAADGFPVELW